MSEVLDNIYIWVFLVKIQSILLLTLVKYMLCSHFTQNCILLYFLEAINPYFVTNIFLNFFLYLCIYFVQKAAQLISQNLLTQEWLVVESCPTPRWIAFLMLYRLVYNIRSRFNELILVCSAYCFKIGVTLLLIFNRKCYQNESWPNTSVSYSKHF